MELSRSLKLRSPSLSLSQSKGPRSEIVKQDKTCPVQHNKTKAVQHDKTNPVHQDKTKHLETNYSSPTKRQQDDIFAFFNLNMAVTLSFNEREQF